MPLSLTQTLARTLSINGSKTSLRKRLRLRRLAPLLAMIEAVAARQGHVSMIDIGGTAQYWTILPPGFLEANRVTVSIVNIPGTVLPEDSAAFRFFHADACDLSMFPDKHFDIAHSNSVIEHVGDWARMCAFASELRRVSRSYFVQTPNYWFPIEPHCMTPFFHWLPKPWRILLVQKFALGHWSRAPSVDSAVRTVDSARLLDRRQFTALFPDSTLQIERFLGLPKSLVAFRASANHD